MTYQDYWTEVRELADYFSEGGRWTEDYGQDTDINDAMHETIDGHAYIIYYTEAHDVLKFSPNDNAYYEEMGENPAGGYNEMAPPMAYFAMLADIRDYIE